MPQKLRRARVPFQPTLPLRGATSLEIVADSDRTFQPTLPLRGATESFP